MHALLLVVGESVVGQIYPFANYANLRPHRVYIEDGELLSMAKKFDIRPTDLSSLAGKLPDWNGFEAEIHQGRISYWSRVNPNGKFDWFTIGGRFADYLQLKEPRPPSFFEGLIGRRPRSSATKALKREIVEEAVLEDPPFAILANGYWVEQGRSKSAPTDEQWKAQFAERFKYIGSDELLTVVDLHFKA